jgi:hypothetical protein
MELKRTPLVGAALTLAVILGLFWGIWLAGQAAFSLGGEHPPVEGRGVPTAVPVD